MVRSRLAALSAEYSWVTVVDFTYTTGNQIHAKVVVVDRRKAVVGSANFSWRGMYGNYEIGVLIRNKPAWTLGKIVDRLSSITSKPYKTKKP